ncbi:MAG: M20/M25/M40 family metallo-hydrolase, partial [Anaerolineales bacterium]
MDRPKQDMQEKRTSQPVKPGDRLVVVDVLRGFALFGILFVNIFSMSGLPYRGPFTDSFSQALMNLIELLVEAKFYHLFSFLFGWGIAIQWLRSRERNQPFLGRFVRRLVILFVIGTLHAVFLWSGDILADYAFFGLLLVFFFWMPSPLILALAVLMIGLAVLRGAPIGFIETLNANREAFIASFNIQIAAPPAFGADYLADVAFRARVFFTEVLNYLWLPYYFFSVFGMFLLGLFVGKSKIFEHIDRHIRLLKIVLVTGLLLGGLANYFFAYRAPSFVPAEYIRFAQFASRTIGAPALMLFYVCGLTLLFERTRFKQRLLPLANVGRMALTNYLTHSVVALIVFQLFGLYRQISLPVALLYVTLLYLAQIRISAWWLENHPFGPMEWLWRTLTYGRLQPWFKVHKLDQDDKPLPEWLQSLSDTWNRLSPNVRLGTFWAVLLVWALALLTWQSNISPRQGTFYQQLTERLSGEDDQSTTGDQESEEGQPEAETVPSVVATPEVEPVEYTPGELAANGDFIALSATFDTELALDHIQTLSDPVYNGRLAGSPQGWAAGEYIAEQFAAFGLQPAGEDGTFFQPFETSLVTLSQTPTMSVQTAAGTTLTDFDPFVDFAPWLYNYAGPGSASGEVIFANNCAHDDFDTITVIDKIVLCRWNVTNEDEVLNALEHGAAGLLLIPSPNFALDFKYDYKPALVPEPMPTLLVSDSVVELLLEGSGVSLSELSLTYHPFELSTSLSMSVEAEGASACVTDPCTSRNVLGVLPGRDPEFRDQVIILGAHYDHMGGAPDGTYWPGANDNASGVSMLLEIARSWQAAGFVPRRTVLFAAWDAEEMGLLGSAYYVANPQYPLSESVAQLNFDVVGAGDGEVSVFVGGGLEEQINALAEAVDIPTVASDVTSSDHASFLSVDIPSGAFYAEGYDGVGTLHRTIDTIDTLNPEALRNVGRLGSLSTMVIADVHPSIETVLQDRQEAVQNQDLDALLATSAGLAQQLDRIWFENLQALEITSFDYQLQDLTVEGDQAVALI